MLAPCHASKMVFCSLELRQWKVRCDKDVITFVIQSHVPHTKTPPAFNPFKTLITEKTDTRLVSVESVQLSVILSLF